MLPVREMVLYKHGVAFFARAGAVSGEETTLTFSADKLNDVLKSLTIFDRAGGQVVSVRYQTPMNRAERLSNSTIRLSDGLSVRDLLLQLRGRRVTITVETRVRFLETVSGRVVGINEGFRAMTDTAQAESFALLDDTGVVRVYRFSGLRELTVQDAQAVQDLTYFLDTTQGDDARRTLTVRLSPGEHDLAIYYVAPGPSWRVSYRFVGESGADGSTGTGYLQGWGLFDNRLDEDLQDVRLTLVAGQPISFIYDLYTSRIPDRPTVEEERRFVPPPQFAGAPPPRPAAAPAAPLRKRPGMYVGGIRADGDDEFEDMSSEDTMRWMEQTAKRQGVSAGFLESAAVQYLADAAVPAAAGAESGDLFQYEVLTPVSVKRGESALVPIIGAQGIAYQRELLYNRAKLPDHPIAAFRLTNTSGLTLERGPAVVMEDGDYRGEALFPFTRDGAEVILPYAVERGITVTEGTTHHRLTNRLGISGRFLRTEYFDEEITTYVLDNTTARPQVVTLEAPARTDWELYDTREPDVLTANERRWRVELPAQGRAQFMRRERARRYAQTEILRLDFRTLHTYLENQWLDAALGKALAEILTVQASIQRARDEREKRIEERKALYEQQQQFRANLQALGMTGKEGTLRERILTQLEASQERLEAIDREITALDRQASEAAEQVEALLEALG